MAGKLAVRCATFSAVVNPGGFPSSMRPIFSLLLAATALSAEPVQISGIYPSLAMFNQEGECGTGAVVPWAGKLWVVTYAPHQPFGSSDKLHEIGPDLRQVIRPESIGGTPANRMIHRESDQLFIGPYAINPQGQVRAISYQNMPGRPTGNARHLADPAGKIVFATMEEGIYEVDVKTLAVKELWGDEQIKTSPHKANLPGYHGKGFYSGQGVYVYANNGDHAAAARMRPDVPSGVLAEWDGKADAWTVVRRCQFTEVTGPGGIHGSTQPATDPIWTIGWDAKSLLLGVRLPAVGWTFYRLPKGSHSYDGAHGWNTEWPRIREIGEKDFLMTMHGTFWRFPKTFTPSASGGIAPRSNYLKVIGDFCRWNDRLVFGCDDTARAEFLNQRKAKGKIAAPQSQSNLWFVEPARVDTLGPAIGRGAVWDREPVKAGQASDPFLFSGYDHRALWLAHDAKESVTFRLEVDRAGDGKWSPLREVGAAPGVANLVAFPVAEAGAWIRIVPTLDVALASAVFTFRRNDGRQAAADAIFAGLAKPGEKLTGGLVRARDQDQRTLAFAASGADGADLGYYELDGDLKLRRVDDPAAHDFTKKNTAIPVGVLTLDEASVVYIDDSGKRWRLPKGDPALDRHPLGHCRVDREVATERDLFNAHGTFYELPAENAGGFAKVRPVATHNRLVHDYGSFRGLLVMSGITLDPPASNPHIIRSDDGKTALWAGTIDDVWSLGKPRGTGGPWKQTAVLPNVPSDPYLMTGYDSKTLKLEADQAAVIAVEIDLTGDGQWAVYRAFEVGPGQAVTQALPEDFSAYWIRFRSDRATTASATLEYR